MVFGYCVSCLFIGFYGFRQGQLHKLPFLPLDDLEGIT